MTDKELIEAMRVEGGAADRGIWKLLGQAANRLEELVEHVADLKVERIGLTAQVNDRDMRIAFLKAEVYRLRSKIDDAQHYIDAQAAAGDAWREGLGKADNVRAQLEAVIDRAAAQSPLVDAAKARWRQNLAARVALADGLLDKTPSPAPTVAEDARQRGIAYDFRRADEPAPATPYPATAEYGRDTVPAEVHERGWQWRPIDSDMAFAPPFGTIKQCHGCGCLVAGGCSSCVRCVEAARRAEPSPIPATPPPTVGELLARLPVVEWFAEPDWFQLRPGVSARSILPRWRHRNASAWSEWGQPWWGDDRKAHMLLPARLVPASEADADPATRGPIGGGA